MTICASQPLLLASRSPRRQQLLGQLGIPLLVVPVDVDESVRVGEEPDPYLERVVSAKLERACELAEVGRCAAVLVADTSVLIGAEILGKPRDDAEGRAMITRLAGGEHVVATRFAVASYTDGRQTVMAKTVRTRVVFRPLSAEEIAQYVASGEGRDKAGSYGIQQVGAFLVARVDGSYSNVVGLPLAELTESLQDAGLLGPLPLSVEPV